MRRSDREVTDIGRINEIIKEAGVLRLAMNDEAYPYIVPMHYGYEFESGKLIFWLHGAKEGKKLDLLKKDPRVCVELDCNMDIISGGDDACAYGAAYSSVIAFGTAEVTEEPSAKIHGLKLLMKEQTGKEFEISEKMASGIAVIRVVCDSFTAKERPVPDIGRRQ